MPQLSQNSLYTKRMSPLSKPHLALPKQGLFSNSTVPLPATPEGQPSILKASVGHCPRAAPAPLHTARAGAIAQFHCSTVRRRGRSQGSAPFPIAPRLFHTARAGATAQFLCSTVHRRARSQASAPFPIAPALIHTARAGAIAQFLCSTAASSPEPAPAENEKPLLPM